MRAVSPEGCGRVRELSTHDWHDHLPRCAETRCCVLVVQSACHVSGSSFAGYWRVREFARFARAARVCALLVCEHTGHSA